MKNTLLERLQNWYQTNCNDNWEHSHGFSIATLDNPGWTIKIDLAETPLESLQFEKNIDNGRFDWMFITTKNKIFEAHCDQKKLTEVLKIFLDEIIPEYADKNFHYPIYIPLAGATAKVWRPAKAKMLTEEILEIVYIPVLKFEDIRAKTIYDITFKRDDIFSFKTTYSVGDKIITELTEMFDGVSLIVKEQ